VIAGGVDDGGAAVGADPQVVQVGVVVDQDRVDGLGLDLASAPPAGPGRVDPDSERGHLSIEGLNVYPSVSPDVVGSQLVTSRLFFARPLNHCPIPKIIGQCHQKSGERMPVGNVGFI
jgi:hypothetical protein